MTIEAVQRLNYNEFFYANSLQDIQELYQNKGLTFKSTQQLEEQIQLDWKTVSKKHKQLVLTEKISDAPLIKTMKVNETNFTIVGFTHRKNLISKNYSKCIEYEINKSNITLHERGIFKQTGLSTHKTIIEINDQIIIPIQHNLFGIAYELATTNILQELKEYFDFNEEYGIKKNYQTRSPKNTLLDSTIKLKKPGYLYAEEYNNTKQNNYFPDNFETKNLKGKMEYLFFKSMCTVQRSAYIADFAKTFQKEYKNILILTGQGHTQEIAYFLNHANNNKIIQKKAKKYAEKSLQLIKNMKYLKNYY